MCALPISKPRNTEGTPAGCSSRNRRRRDGRQCPWRGHPDRAKIPGPSAQRTRMEAADLLILARAGSPFIGTGLPAFVVLIGGGVALSGMGTLTAALPHALLKAVPWR